MAIVFIIGVNADLYDNLTKIESDINNVIQIYYFDEMNNPMLNSSCYIDVYDMQLNIIVYNKSLICKNNSHFYFPNRFKKGEYIVEISCFNDLNNIKNKLIYIMEKK